jgi:CRP/FNR family transcriptional regulator, cyclic AMP receptor protein
MSSAHVERRQLAEQERRLAKAEFCIEARVTLLQRMPVFGGIRSDVVQWLVALCPVLCVLENEFFFREGDQADSMFVIQSGKVAVLKSSGKREYLLSTLKEGDCFGEMALMDHGPRSASVRAVLDCSAICLSAADLYKLYSIDPKQFALIQMNLGREVCRRLREANDRLFRASKDRSRVARMSA